jgi:hypothetical protein
VRFGAAALRRDSLESSHKAEGPECRCQNAEAHAEAEFRGGDPVCDDGLIGNAWSSSDPLNDAFCGGYEQSASIIYHGVSHGAPFRGV